MALRSCCIVSVFGANCEAARIAWTADEVNHREYKSLKIGNKPERRTYVTIGSFDLRQQTHFDVGLSVRNFQQGSQLRWLSGWGKSWLFGVIGLLLVASSSLSEPNFDRILELVTQRGGSSAAQRFQSWRSLILVYRHGSDLERLTRVNNFFNRQILFEDDTVIWGQSDYWATPSETLGMGRGDCEDFVIAKYFTLLQMGFTSERFRLIYVRARTGTGSGVSDQAHMVLAYYVQPDAEPLILDNLISDIRPASRRPDLLPVFSFDQDSLFTGSPGRTEIKIGGIGRLSRWEDLLKRARLEGFD